VLASQGDFYRAAPPHDAAADDPPHDPVRPRVRLLESFLAEQIEDAAADTAGPIVIANGDQGAHAYGERVRAIVPRGGAAGAK
jgi:hypothetical protein